MTDTCIPYTHSATHSCTNDMTAAAKQRMTRPPIVTVTGHIDHGKSTLLDYIRSTRVTDTEAGGITQHISAYEVEHTTASGEVRTITFLDTPGHEAFQHLRSRGSNAADLAILVVAADDGVKPQTLEALKAIEEAHIPFLVAISKIDKPNADIEHAKRTLLEHGVYLEGLGGDISYVPISSKTGEGVSTLLDLLLLAADLEDLTGDPDIPAEGLVIESRCDPRRGISAVVVIRDGALRAGEYMVAGNAYAPLRIMENFLGQRVESARFSTPLMVTGFSSVPPVGEPFTTVHDKKTAVSLATAHEATHAETFDTVATEGVFILPILIKADVVGSIEAIKHELRKQEDDRTLIRFVHEGVGAVAENDVKVAMGNKNTVVIGFNVGTDSAATELAERHGIEIARFTIIYDLADWLPGAIAARRPKVSGEKELAIAKVLKCFSADHKQQTIGCRIESGTLSVRDRIRIIRHGEEVGRGHIENLKSGKSDVEHVSAGNDCGAQLHIALENALVYNDTLQAFSIVES